jgi:HlyD family secretion protein
MKAEDGLLPGGTVSPSRSSQEVDNEPNGNAVPIVAAGSSPGELEINAALRDGKAARSDSGSPREGSAQSERAAHALLHGAKRGWDFLIRRGVSRAETPNASQTERIRRGLEKEFRTGLRTLIVVAGIVGIWAVAVPLSAAVVIAGTLVAASNIKKVQHPTGGIVAQIMVQDGRLVNEGDLLVRLDDTQARTSLAVLKKQLGETRAHIARLVAERDGASEMKPPSRIGAEDDDGSLQQALSSEKLLFEARATSRENQKELLRREIAQFKEQITGFEAQIKSKNAQHDLANSELRGLQDLYNKHLVPLTRLTALQREAAGLDGELGQLTSEIAGTQSKISGAELQIVRVDQDFLTGVAKDLSESQTKEGELAERSVAAQDQLSRTDIRAPTSGVIHQLGVHTIGGVVGPGEVIMEIVPDADALQIEARLMPNDVDQVHLGQKAIIRLSALNQRTTPQLSGVVSYVSADLTHDRQTNAGYYTVRATLPLDELHRLGNVQLVSGMPAELFLRTGSRTMMSYLLKPVADQLRRSFKQR